MITRTTPLLVRSLAALGALSLAAGCDGKIDGGSGAFDGAPTLPDAATASPDAAAVADAAPADAALPPAPDAEPSTYYTLADSLRDGTLGNPIGGAFGAEGWTVTSATDRIWYSIPRLATGSIEFTVTNITNANLIVADNEIFAMYDGGYGIGEPINYNPEYRENHYKCMIRIYGQEEVGRVGQQKIMWGMCPSGDPGYGACTCESFFEEPFGGSGTWDGSPERLRVEWGDGTTRFLRNGGEVLSIDWSASGLQFGPSELHFSLGSSRTTVGAAAMPIGAVFSDLVVEGWTGPLATCP